LTEKKVEREDDLMVGDGIAGVPLALNCPSMAISDMIIVGTL
jgi:heptaprenylglyceryl phosphate synthase